MKLKARIVGRIVRVLAGAVVLLCAIGYGRTLDIKAVSRTVKQWVDSSEFRLKMLDYGISTDVVEVRENHLHGHLTIRKNRPTAVDVTIESKTDRLSFEPK